MQLDVFLWVAQKIKFVFLTFLSPISFLFPILQKRMLAYVFAFCVKKNIFLDDTILDSHKFGGNGFP